MGVDEGDIACVCHTQSRMMKRVYIRPDQDLCNVNSVFSITETQLQTCVHNHGTYIKVLFKNKRPRSIQIKFF